MIMRYQTWTIYICLLFLLYPQAPNRIEHIKEIKAKAAWRVLTRSPNPPLMVFPGHGKARHQLGSKVHFIHSDNKAIDSAVMTDDTEIPKAEMLIGSW